MKKTVVIGFLGTQLDYGGRGAARWAKWRPTVAACQQEDLLVHRLHLLHDDRSRGLAERVALDIAAVSPETEVCRVEIGLHDPWDFEEVYTTLHDFARAYPFDTEQEDYLIHITTGTHVAQICWFLLAEARFLPARLLQMSPPRKKEVAGGAGTYAIIDLDLSRYDKIAQRFRHEQADTLAFLKSGIATRSAAFNAMIERLERVAGRSRAPLLLVGPTGAGKSFLARRVYELKRQRQRLGGRFVEVNCATLRGDAAMSTLFGHVRGAFTGAQSERPGLLRAADGGLLFLDEIAELGLDEQAMLLKAVEENAFSRSAATVSRAAIFSSSPAPTAICAAASPTVVFARTFWRASTCGHSSCPASLRASRTSNRTWTSNSGVMRASRRSRSASMPKRDGSFWLSRARRKRSGAATSASCRHRSRAWRRSPKADESTKSMSAKRSPACAAPGPTPAAMTPPANSSATAPRRSTCSSEANSTS